MTLLDKLKDWKEFEDVIADIFRAKGWDVTYKPAAGPDGGRDIICDRVVDRELSKINIRTLIQCKYRDKAISEKDVGSILDIAVSFNANTYLLAVKDRLTTGLQNLLERLNTETSLSFRSLTGSEIVSLIQDNESIFQKYFPNEYQQYVDNLEAVNEYNLTKLYRRLFGKDPHKEEIHQLMRLKYRLRVETLSTYSKIWRDQTVKNKLGQIYRIHLGRTPDPVGIMEHGMLLVNGVTTADVTKQIMASDEYLSRQPKVVFDFVSEPLFKVSFDKYSMDFEGWWTYHRRDFEGSLEVIKAKSGKQMIVMSPGVPGGSFRLAYPYPPRPLNKTKLKMRFKSEHDFEIFALVTGMDDRLHFVAFLPQGGGEDSHTSEGISYAFDYIGEKYCNGKWHTLTKSLDRVSRERLARDVKAFNYFCFHVKGPFSIDYLEVY